MAEQKYVSNYDLRSGLILYSVQQAAIEELLTDLAKQIPAQFILLVDVTGQIISTRGEQPSQVDLAALGSLVSGDLAASKEIARLTDQYQEFQMVLREGQTTHTFICGAGRHLAMMVQVSTEITLGWARMVIRRAAQQLKVIATSSPIPHNQTEIPSLDLALKSKDLPGLFNKALDDMWLES